MESSAELKGPNFVDINTELTEHNYQVKLDDDVPKSSTDNESFPKLYVQDSIYLSKPAVTINESLDSQCGCEAGFLAFIKKYKLHQLCGLSRGESSFQCEPCGMVFSQLVPSYGNNIEDDDEVIGQDNISEQSPSRNDSPVRINSDEEDVMEHMPSNVNAVNETDFIEDDDIVKQEDSPEQSPGRLPTHNDDCLVRINSTEENVIEHEELPEGPKERGTESFAMVLDSAMHGDVMEQKAEEETEDFIAPALPENDDELQEPLIEVETPKLYTASLLQAVQQTEVIPSDHVASEESNVIGACSETGTSKAKTSESGTKSAKTHFDKMSDKCYVCGKFFTSKSAMRLHLKLHADVMRYRCDKCGKAFIFENQLNEHRISHILTGKKHQCDLCGKSYVHKGSLSEHLRGHFGEKPHKCNVCGKGFVMKYLLDRHCNIHSNEKLHVCETCGKSFREPRQLKEHTRIHSGEKPYKCKLCEKSFTRCGDRNTHMLTHNSERPYQCEICGKAFSLSSNLKRHRITHSTKPGEGSFKCEECGTCLKTSSSLKKHVKLHFNPDHFKCEICGKTFSSLSAFKRHKLLHTGERPFKCEFCEKAFTRDSHLKVHRMLHTGERPYECEKCGMNFIQKISFTQHMRIHSTSKNLDNVKS